MGEIFVAFSDYLNFSKDMSEIGGIEKCVFV